MDSRDILPLPPESPWASWARPDIRHCEANGAGWIAAPTDTWSNLAYFAAAAWLWSRRDEPAARALAAITFAIGLTSFLFHASYTFAFQVFDYGGMFLYSAWILSLGLRRLSLLSGPQARIFFPGLAAASTAAVALFHSWGVPVQPLFGVQAIAAAAVEAWLWLKGNERDVSRKTLLATMALAAAGFVFWNMDHADWFCRPDDHILQGHAIWHLLTAASFAPAFLYYKQLPQ